MNRTIRLDLLALLLAGFLTATGASAAEELPDDEALQARITSAFENAAEYEDSLVEVHSHRGFILLLGQVGSQELKSQATNTVVFASSAIRRIINELQVVASVDTSTATADAELSVGVLTELAALDATLAEKVRAPVHLGVVYLMGALTQEEIARVTERVGRIPGVTSIRTAFEIVAAP